jgi:TPR repeat protein
MTRLYRLVAVLVLALGVAQGQQKGKPAPVQRTPMELFDSASKGDKVAVQQLTALADSGHADAQLWFGLMYENGVGVPKDYVQAIQWFRKSGDQGNAQAQMWLGTMFANLDGLTRPGVPKDYAQATQWLRRAADQGNELAQYGLGLMYENGNGVPKDYTQAVQWYRKAADKELAVAEYKLGNMYVAGTGVPKDLVTAYMWLNLAATQGDPKDAKTVRDTLEKLMSPQQIAEAQKLSREWKPKK